MKVDRNSSWRLVCVGRTRYWHRIPYSGGPYSNNELEAWISPDCAGGFIDIEVSSRHEIEEYALNNYTNGRYDPSNPLTRKQAIDWLKKARLKDKLKGIFK